MTQPPFLHDLVVALKAPHQVWSAPDGQVTGAGMQGAFTGDDRVLALAVVEIPGHQLVAGGACQQTADEVRFDYLIRRPLAEPDPRLTLSRRRRVDQAGVAETITITSGLAEAAQIAVRLRLAPDATSMATLRSGGSAADAPPTLDGTRWHWRDDRTTAELELTGAIVEWDDQALVATWTVEVPARSLVEIDWRLNLTDLDAVTFGAPDDWEAPAPSSEAPPPIAALLKRSLSDVAGLRMGDERGNVFLAAGAPWYFTLFGRDSLIAARFLLSVDPGLALSTLSALAVHQGTAVDPDSGEQPGKIPHEIRRETLRLFDGTVLPPVYYGSIDSTLLWIRLLHDTWRAGVDFEAIVGLLPSLRLALQWLREHADSDSDGFIEYQDASGHGLTNQGWKDSRDSVRFGDGRQAEGPIALVEVQGYAYAAARAWARLLAAMGESPVERAESLYWDRYAEDLAARFRATFWVNEDAQRYPALALDGAKQPVDSVTSNIGHLINTGILSQAEERLVVDRLLAEDMFTGYGIRTLSCDHPAYWPLSYHNGSVWTHDTVLILDNMRRSGFSLEARRLAEGQLRAAQGFDFSFPELFGGQPAADRFPPHAYPSSCKPQAWAAAAAVPIARALGVVYDQLRAPRWPHDPHS